MNKKRLSLIGAVALVALGTLVLVKYVGTAEDRALAGEELVDVLVLTGNVPAGTPASELQSSLRVESVPVKVRAAGALASLGEAADMVVAQDLVEGEQLTQARLVPSTEFAASQNRVGRGGGTVTVPDGLLEITIPLDPVRTVGGTIRPGDLVGVIVSVGGEASGEDAAAGVNQETSAFVLHKILVTNVQGEPVAEPPLEANTVERTPIPAANFLVTLAVDAPSAEKIVFASSYGDIWLALEPADAVEGGTSPQNVDSLIP